MIISHRHKFVYVKTRKTASTSIEIALSRFCGPDDVITRTTWRDEALRREFGYPGPQNEVVRTRSGEQVEILNHTPAGVARDVLGDAWPEYFTFALERNPFDRVISQYYWELPVLTRRHAVPPTLARFVADCPAEVLSNWHLYADAEDLLVDYVGTYESLDESLLSVSERIGLPETIEVSGIKTKAGWRKDRRHWREVLSELERDRIQSVCRREIEAFGYHW